MKSIVYEHPPKGVVSRALDAIPPVAAVAEARAGLRNIARAIEGFQFRPREFDLTHFTIRDLELRPLPGPRWVRVKTALAGIDPGELTSLAGRLDEGKFSAGLYPRCFVPGSEAVGTVLEKGDQVTAFSDGDRVLVDPWFRIPGAGGPPIAPDAATAAGGFKIGAAETAGGGWSEFFAAHEAQLFRLPETVSFEEALLVPTFARASAAVERMLEAAPRRVVVVGTGATGLAIIMMLRALKRRCRIIALADAAFDGGWAYDLGADGVATLAGDAGQVLSRLARLLDDRLTETDHGAPHLAGGADVVFETLGASAGLAVAMGAARERAQIIACNWADRLVPDWSMLFFRELTLTAAIAHAPGVAAEGETARHPYERLFDAMRAAPRWAPPLLTHRYPLSKYEEAIRTAVRGPAQGAIKVAFEFQRRRRVAANG
ncbi:MAG: alcohol dehydrogenase catalytic domain-containing protein [Planctomycetes bacterium]|nr:alcohol dehydrogenase catalytic domain-containing protein [Planctomycetota bacterium]